MLTHSDPQVFYKIKKFLGFGQILNYKTKPIICCNTSSSSFKRKLEQNTKDILNKRERVQVRVNASGKEKIFSQLRKQEQILNIGGASGSKKEPNKLVSIINNPSSIKHNKSHEIKYFKFQILDLKGL
jgi:hypothetical protein